MGYIHLKLDMQNGKHIFYDENILRSYKEDLTSFISNNKYLNDFDFAKSVMMSQEIKANNLIEGINNDLKLINDVIDKKYLNISKEERHKIINLYKGYKYILRNKEINKDNLRELYSILSNNILDKEDIKKMGSYYRLEPVYILRGNSLDAIKPFMGFDSDKIDYSMEQFFSYVNSDNSYNQIDTFIKSQIMHFYFVYIHPYFDVNGRTSRTVAMWYLLNNKDYPYIIFNRAITFSRSSYIRSIINSRKYGNITHFLKYMLKNVAKELEKDYIVRNVSSNSPYKLTDEDKEIIEYMITMKNNLTTKDLSVTYNRFNEHKKYSYILKNIINPLIDKDVIKVTGYNKNNSNIKITINNDLFDTNDSKIKYINLKKYQM